jgi:uncharacterized protein with ParB-like and HNH nuclease domain
MYNNTQIFSTRIVNLKEVNQYTFSIPTYQRPYVWGDEQLKKILDDFFIAFKSTPDEPYFVSTFLTKENESNAELIDGQQRLTTLWLIAFVVSKISPDSELSNFLKKEGKLRFNFEIRTEVAAYLDSLIDTTGYTTKKETADIEKQPYVINIANGLTFIKSYFDTLKKEKNNIKEFGNFIYNNVKLIKNTTPKNTDLNKLFSTINSAGVQLEQTDIVKANLLKQIDDKVKYSKIWESCENTGNFFERNARISFSSTAWDKLNLRNHIAFNETVFKFQNTYTEAIEDVFSIDNLTLQDIEAYEYPSKKTFNENDRDSKEVYCRSIINFGQLLLHTYRIHLKREGKSDFEGTFHVKRLIEIFKELEARKDTEEIKRFFLLLWDIRYLFDKYIIKWVSDIDTKAESLELMNFNRNEKSYYSRSKYEKSENQMLQSVLYFTGDYLRQYWLTSYLDYLLYNHENKNPTDILHLSYLEQIDNIFSIDKSITDKELSWKLMHQTKGFVSTLKINEYLSSHSGTGFKHYWFQKLEYLLWKEFKTKNDWENNLKSKFDNFRITSKNSVEHIYPQNPVYQDKLNEEYLDDFGNLVLLSVAQNSEYSNKSVEEKRASFNDKPTFDSLKSFLIFTKSYESEWDNDSILKHREEVINRFKTHYNKYISSYA